MDIRLECPSLIWKQARRRPCEAAAHVLDDRFSVDGVSDGMPHAAIGEYRIAHVEAEIREVEAWRWLDLERAVLGELVHDVGRQIVDDKVGGALRRSRP